MDVEKLYQKKLLNADEAISLIPQKSNLVIGMRAATPPALLASLAKRAKSRDIVEAKIYYVRCGDIAMKPLLDEDLFDVIHLYSSMFTRAEVELINKGYEKGKKYINFVPIPFSRFPSTIKKIMEVDAFLVTVAPMDKFGYFNFGINGDYAIELSRYAKKLIVEVNQNMPRTSGGTSLHVSEVDAIVENHVPLLEKPSRPSTQIDHKIGESIIPLIPNEATIQMGIGGVPNAVCEQLVDHKNLGIHTEVITSGMVDLIKCGAVTNTHKSLHPFVNVFTFALGDRALYDFIDNNPSMICLPVSYVNEPNVIGQNKNMISINSFIEIDFSGQVNAEFIGHQFSGVGGQLDFVRGAYYSENGKTILASTSTAQGGTISRIVPRLNSIATDTRLDTDYVVTEYGSCRLLGKSTSERTLALIGIAHPKFRDDLLKQAKEQKFI